MNNLEKSTQIEKADDPAISTGKVFRGKFKNAICIISGVAIMACSSAANALPPSSSSDMDPGKTKDPVVKVEPPKKKIDTPKKKEAAESSDSVEFDYEEHGNLSGPEIKERLKRGEDASINVKITNDSLIRLKNGEDLNESEVGSLVSIANKYGANGSLLSKTLKKDVLGAEDYQIIKAEIKKIFEGQLKAVKYHLKLRTWLLTVMSLSDDGFNSRSEKNAWISGCIEKIRSFKTLEAQLEKTIAAM